MEHTFNKIIRWLFYSLFFIVPLIIYPKTSEIFEFNKIVTVYGFTVIIASVWIAKMIVARKIIFKKSLIDPPILAFIFAMGISTILSIDQRTSLFGYYSRYNGGLLSILSYFVLYWAYVSNIQKEQTIKLLIVLLFSTLLTSIWAILEHFGRSFSCLIFPDFRVFDNSCWAQDVQNRVYSTFGQPNWLAAWLVALIPIVLAFLLRTKEKIINIKTAVYYLLFAGFFITLLFTKSRSGILAFTFSYIIFWYSHLTSNKQRIRTNLFPFIFNVSCLIIIIILLGTPWTPGLTTPDSKNLNNGTVNAPALERGGTESGEIRKIVWKGALNIWKSRPLVGTGLETFGYSYYTHRPVEHNLTSEWDFLYNKAHNEYLNYLATTGVIGLLAYLVLVGFTLTQILKVKKGSKNSLMGMALLSGYTSILITNFFGFSTVPINLLFFMFPAFAVSIGTEKEKFEQQVSVQKLSIFQKIQILATFILGYYLLINVLQYWQADYVYARGKRFNDSGSFFEASKILNQLVIKSPSEATYWDELANSTANVAIYYSENSQVDLAVKNAKDCFNQSKNALKLSPANIALKKRAAARLISLVAIDQNYISLAKNILEEAIILAPTDAKMSYNLALTYLRTNDLEKALEQLQKTIELKPNYELAHYALAQIYIDINESEKAKEELNYIINFINPNNVNVKRQLNELN